MIYFIVLLNGSTCGFHTTDRMLVSPPGALKCICYGFFIWWILKQKTKNKKRVDYIFFIQQHESLILNLSQLNDSIQLWPFCALKVHYVVLGKTF